MQSVYSVKFHSKNVGYPRNKRFNVEEQVKDEAENREILPYWKKNFNFA